MNSIWIKGHQGPHPEKFHKCLYEFMTNATKNARNDKEYTDKFVKAIEYLYNQVETRGTQLNKWVTK